MISTAIKFMRFEKSKSIGIIIGIIISVFLIGQQLSTLSFLTRLMAASVAHSDPTVANIWVVTNQTNNVNALKPISVSLVNQIRSIDGVEETYPVVMNSATMKFDNGQFSSVLLIGSDAPSLIMGPSPKSIEEGRRSSLTHQGAFSVDLNDVKNFHHDVHLGTQVEINGKRASLSALTRGIRGYGISFLYSTTDNVRAYAGLSQNEVNAVVVKVHDGANVNAVASRITQTFPGVRAWPRDELKSQTIREILRESNMGVSFGSLVAFAVISGFFIIGLTLYTATFDRVKDYGTLKAIGASNRYIRRLVLTQAFLYGIVGYVLAMALLFMMKVSVAKTGLILIISPWLIITLLIMTLFISVGGSFFAIIKLRNIEPASVFK